MKYKIFFNKDFLNLVHNNIRNDEFKNNNNNIFSIGINESKKNVFKTNISIIKNNITINTLFYDLNHESKFSIFKKLFDKNIFDIKHFFLHNSFEEFNFWQRHSVNADALYWDAPHPCEGEFIVIFNYIRRNVFWLPLFVLYRLQGQHCLLSLAHGRFVFPYQVDT